MRVIPRERDRGARGVIERATREGEQALTESSRVTYLQGARREREACGVGGRIEGKRTRASLRERAEARRVTGVGQRLATGGIERTVTDEGERAVAIQREAGGCGETATIQGDGTASRVDRSRRPEGVVVGSRNEATIDEDRAGPGVDARQGERTRTGLSYAEVTVDRANITQRARL